jgi:protein TonB
MERPQKPVENTDSRAPEVPEITESASSNGEPALDAQPFGASDVSPALPAAGGGTIIDVSSLTVSKKVLPEYPMISRKRRDQGTVTLIVTIRSGRVLSVEVERGSGHAPLDESAVRAARSWEFDSSGYGDTVTARIPFVFKLE